MKLTYGMVGGDLSAFIGEVHRKAINFVDDCTLVSGCFSSNEKKNHQTAEHYHIDQERRYNSYQEMATAEAARKDKIDFVVITTPNHLHYEVSKAFMLAGINVVCEKPLCFTVDEAKELKKIAEEKNILFAITYTYSGYSMVKYAKQLIKDGKIGDIINVQAEYPQDWLISAVSETMEKPNLSIWRLNPTYSGVSNSVGDIGTHIEYTVKYITGLKLKRVAANVSKFTYDLDLSANMMVQYTNGVNGLYWCSQVALGHPNGFKIRVYGTKGSLAWFQETPDYLHYSSIDGITSKLTRGADYVYGSSKQLNKTPKGHPEGYHEAFANIYKVYLNTLIKKKQNLKLEEVDFDFPSIQDGIDGVAFIHAVIESDKNDSKWITLKQ